MPARALLDVFPTTIYRSSLQTRGATAFNARLLRECLQMRADDVAGRRWSARHYPGGYTSYASQCRMHRLSPTFAQLERLVQRHVARYVHALALDLTDRTLAMTDCWINLMPPGVVHSLHLHPLATISGTYYVRTPTGSAPLKLEDPRLDRFMAAPPKRADAPPHRRPWVSLPARAGQVVLFESWLRHEVPPHRGRGERVSISFNFSWF